MPKKIRTLGCGVVLRASQAQELDTRSWTFGGVAEMSGALFRTPPNISTADSPWNKR
jgi:hypothetical protein